MWDWRHLLSPANIEQECHPKGPKFKTREDKIGYRKRKK